MHRRSFIALALMSVNLMACCCGGGVPVPPAQQPEQEPARSPPRTPEAMISTFGRPDIDDSTENDNPRPIQVTRWFIYKNENVRAYFIPDDRHKFMDKGPIPGWQFFQLQDNKTNAVIGASEAYRRLAELEKKVIDAESPEVKAQKKAWKAKQDAIYFERYGKKP